MKALVTGGLGFIGSFIVDELVKEKHHVRVLDNLEPQVHAGKLPDYTNPEAEVIIGDVRDPGVWSRVLEDVEVIFHQAAMVGMGQSQYLIDKYVDVNVTGTAKMLDYLANHEHNVKKLLVAASMSSYGEGLYKCSKCGLVEPPMRSNEQINSKMWGLRCPTCNSQLSSMPTPETKRLDSSAVYSLTKKYQEEMCLSFGKTYSIPVVSMRYFNAYGPRQSLSNPYTGVAALFTSRLKNGNTPLVFEDGLQNRDFIHVEDVACANVFLMNHNVSGEAFNIGTGNTVSILDLARKLAQGLGVDIEPRVLNQGRPGDVRYCYADNSKLSSLGFSFKYPELDIDTLIDWSKAAVAVDKSEKALNEMKQRGLL